MMNKKPREREMCVVVVDPGLESKTPASKLQGSFTYANLTEALACKKSSFWLLIFYRKEGGDLHS